MALMGNSVRLIHNVLIRSQVNCSALLSFAASQPSAAYPASPPTGAVTWKQLYTSPPVNLAMSSLPDLATQIQEYLSSQSDSAFGETIFAISFGFWDIYHLAGLDYELAQNMTDAAIDHLVSQINLLYTHFTKQLSNNPRNASSSVPSFQLVIPKLFDPTLAPGWISQRSMPLSPSSVAEQQKQAVYLTERWNSLLENALGSWVAADANEDNAANETDTAGNENQATLPLPRKDIFYYDLPQYILDIIIEHQLEDAGQSDAAGLGKGESPFVSVAEPCLRDGAEDEKEEDGVWNTVCPDPSAYLFWDGFNLGGTANAGLGVNIAGIVKQGMRMGG